MGVVDAETGTALKRAGIEAGSGPEPRILEDKVEIVIGEAKGHAILPGNLPAPAECRGPSRKPRLQVRGNRAHQTLTSTTGIDGISPAENPARLVWMRSVSKRTGTSNSNPAVTCLPAPGAAARLTVPCA